MIDRPTQGYQGQNQGKPWNKFVRGAEKSKLFCEYHQRAGHSTEECRNLQALLFADYQKDGKKLVLDRNKPHPKQINQVTQPKNEAERFRIDLFMIQLQIT
ncbi:hypothetical protein U6M95_12490 [Cutibacterium acnes]